MMTPTKNDWRWRVEGDGFRDRVFKHRNAALDLAAKAVANGETVGVNQLGGWIGFAVSTDADGAILIQGNYDDVAKRYLSTRIAHEMALRNVGDKSLRNVKGAAA